MVRPKAALDDLWRVIRLSFIYSREWPVQAQPGWGFPRLNESIRWGRRQSAPGDALFPAIRFLACSSFPSRGAGPSGAKARC